MYPDIDVFYNGKVLAITGGTGFLGQAVVEKVLRCCPDVKEIALFIRNKKGLNPQERLHKLWNQPVSMMVF